MSFKLRLVVYFLIASIIPLVIAGSLTLNQTVNRAEDQVVSQLESIVDVQESRINESVDRYLEQASLITSRNFLRQLVSEVVEKDGKGVDQELAGINTILNDARNSVNDIKNIAVYSLDEELIATTNAEYIRSDTDLLRPQSEKTHIVANLFRDKDNILRARIVGPLIYNKKTIAIVEIVASASPIISITEDYTGLGDTGEIVLARLNTNGDALFITPLRFDSEAALNRVIVKEDVNKPIISVVYGGDRTFRASGTMDYRDKPVLAAGRYIESLGWGLVVKIDRAEAIEATNQIATSFALISVAAISASIVFAVYSANLVTNPLDRLRKVANKISEGEFSKGVGIHSNDEIGELAAAFNTMANHVATTYEELEHKVAERTEEIKEIQRKTEVKLDDSEKLNVIMTNRELKMIELKKQIKELEQQLKQAKAKK